MEAFNADFKVAAGDLAGFRSLYSLISLFLPLSGHHWTLRTLMLRVIPTVHQPSVRPIQVGPSASHPIPTSKPPDPAESMDAPETSIAVMVAAAAEWRSSGSDRVERVRGRPGFGRASV